MRAADPAERPPLIPGADARAPDSYFGGIQCLRFVAAFIVVLRHATYYAHERLTPDTTVWINGGAGVDIFFIISGFVMMITAHNFIGRKDGWKDFALRRIVRVVPLYWLATSIKLAALLLIPAVVLHASLDWGYVAKSYLFIPAYNVDGEINPLMAVGWTLLFEMFFYLVFTIALALRVNVMAFCAAVLVACALGSLVRPVPGPAWMLYLNPIVLEFLIGMVFARWCTGLRLSRAVCIGLMVAGVAVILAIPGEEFDRSVVLRGVGPALLVLGTIAIERHVKHFPRLPVFLGAASYSLYMMHPLIAPLGPSVLARLGVPSASLSILLSIALSLGAAVGAFLLFEKPVTKMLSRLIRRPRAHAGAPLPTR